MMTSAECVCKSSQMTELAQRSPPFAARLAYEELARAWTAQARFSEKIGSQLTHN
jgi:hypothetical protein